MNETQSNPANSTVEIQKVLYESMDAVFHLDEVSRAEYLQLLMHSIGCTYICLRSYSYMNQANCLIGLDGCYTEENTQLVAMGLFVQYRQLVFPLENSGLVPGFAFSNNLPYIELAEPELRSQASDQIQRQFYQEAGIKRAVFMGCRSGEIELGSSNVVHLNMEMELRRIFPQDFSRQLSHVGDQFPQPTNPNPNIPSSSSSLSTGSPVETIPSSMQQMSSSIDYSCQQAMQALNQIRSNIQLPTLESENAAITRAILAVLTSSTSHFPRDTQNSPYGYQLNPKATAFKPYVPPITPVMRTSNLQSQSILKRTILFYRNFIFVRPRGEQPGQSRPTSNQLHRVMSERRRREKINEHLVALRSLFPFCTKKDKVSVLINSREYLASLKAQIARLSQQNQLLQARLLPAAGEDSGSSNERLNVRIIPVSESTSEQRIVDLRIRARGGRPVENILIHLLEFLRLDRNVNLMSVEANTQISELGPVNHVNLRLRIEGNAWDESSFQEAVRRLVADLAQ